METVPKDKDNWLNLMIALNRFKNKALHMEETKKPYTNEPRIWETCLSVAGMKMT